MKNYLTLLLIAATLCAAAQTRNFMLVKQPAQNNGQRKAVVIGMGNYGGNNTLNNTLKDADDMAQTLTQLGFTVTLIKDNDLQHLTQNLAAWYASIQNSDVALFYFSGHGMEIDGENYLLPVNLAITTESDVKYQTYSLNQVLDNMDEKNVALKLVLLDACRDNPYKKSWHKGVGGTGLAQVTAPDGTFIAYAAAPGHVADDGEDYGLQNGVFTYFIKTELLRAGLTLDQVFNKITGDVRDKTQKRQTPYVTKSVSSDVVLMQGNPTGLTVIKQPPANNQPVNPPVQPPAVVLGLENMVLVQDGTFNMGSNDAESNDDEQPMHAVTVSSFYISKYLVTQAQWRAVMGNNPSVQKCEECPVENITWDDAQAYCRKKSSETGKTYRLPTEAEWEYAAQGGNKSNGYTYSGSNNIDDVAWYASNSGSATHPVGQKQPNELGLYDMTGNVWEWCNDWYDGGYYSSNPSQNPQGASSGSSRVLRGGSCSNEPRYCRAADRYSYLPSFHFGFIGFRPVVSF